MSNVMEQPEKALILNPMIWDYVQPVEYLKAHYNYRKSMDKNFSFAVWAQELGLKSRSFLRLVLIEKRSLTEDLSHLFIQNLKLNKSETQYFTHLVGLQRATQLQTKEFHSQEISKLRKKFLLKKHSLTEVNQKDLYDFLSSYQTPRLQVLLTMEEVDKSVESLSQLLKMKPSETQAQLQVLKNLNLANEDENKKWSATQNQISTADALGNVALQSFHRKSLEEAIQALTLPKETRRYQSLVMPLTEEQFEQLHQELRFTIESMLQKFDTKEIKSKKVYQINLNIIPVTGTIDRPKQNTGETIESEPTGRENP